MIFSLQVFLFMFLFLVYIVSKGDFMTPAFLLLAGFLLSTLFSLFLTIELGVDISGKTVLFVLIGIVCFLLGSLLIKVLFFSNAKRHIKDIQYIYVDAFKVTLINVLAIFTIGSTIFYMMKSYASASSWLAMMNQYRYATAYGSLTGESFSMPSYISFFKFFILFSAFLFVYIIVNNYLCNKKIEWNMLTTVVFGLLLTLIGASRLDLVRIPIAAVSIYYLLSLRKGSMNTTVQLKLFGNFFSIAIAVILTFSLIRGIVGRVSDLDTIEYLAYYIGASIINLDSYFKQPVYNFAVFGKETFWGINHMIGVATGEARYIYDYTLEFNTIKGVSTGNVYTAFRMFYADFGFWGIVILPFVQGVLFSFCYLMIKFDVKIRWPVKLWRPSVIDFRLLIYSLVIYSVILMFYADWFYSQVLSWYQIKGMILMWIAKIWLVDSDKKNFLKR